MSQMVDRVLIHHEGGQQGFLRLHERLGVVQANENVRPFRADGLRLLYEVLEGMAELQQLLDVYGQHDLHLL